MLHGCGGASDTPTAGSQSARRAQVQLDDPLTNGDAARAAASEAGRQHRRAADGTSLAIDTQDREAVRQFYNHVYVQPDVPMEWTGSYAQGNAGTVSAAYQAATSLRINWYRAMAGLPAATTISESNSGKDQEAALLMSANGELSHYPPSTWKFYTATAAEAARNSNLALGNNGPSAIDAYISDFGDNNGPVGHRRWILYPQTRMFGSGDVPPAEIEGTRLWGANALWTLDGGYGSARPTTRDGFVAWPTRGYVPYQVVYGRWSLSYPDADFSQAKVAVTRDGNPVTASIENTQSGYGENTIVWQVAGTARDERHERPAADVRYHVSVSGVRVGQAVRSFDYDVVVFDPATETPGALRPQVSAPASVQIGANYAAHIAPLPGATGYSLYTYQLEQFGRLGADDYGTATWSLGTTVSAGTLAPGVIRLYVDEAGKYQARSVTLNKKLLVSTAGGDLTFNRSVGFAMPSQTFKVQVSPDDGANWTDVYSEAGQDTASVPAATKSASLNAFAGRMVQLRLLLDNGNRFYIGSNSGWTVRDLVFTGVGKLTGEQEQRSSADTFGLTAIRPGTVVLVPRVQYQNLYYADSGPPVTVNVEGALLHGPRANYTLAYNGGVLTITDTRGSDGAQTVRNPFRVDFTDVTLAFDTDGNAGRAYRLYRAALDRKPDSAGLGFWIHALDGGAKAEEMAQGFVASDEFVQRYGSAPGNAQMIAAMYRNVLHRAPDDAGAAFWQQQMANGLTVAGLLVQFSDSAENRQQVAAEVALGIAYTRP